MRYAQPFFGSNTIGRHQPKSNRLRTSKIYYSKHNLEGEVRRGLLMRASFPGAYLALFKEKLALVNKNS